MIVIKGVTSIAKVDNSFEDREFSEAFDYYIQLQENGWDRVEWLYLPNVNYEQYIAFWTKRLLRYL